MGRLPATLGLTLFVAGNGLGMRLPFNRPVFKRDLPPGRSDGMGSTIGDTSNRSQSDLHRHSHPLCRIAGADGAARQFRDITVIPVHHRFRWFAVTRDRAAFYWGHVPSCKESIWNWHLVCWQLLISEGLWIIRKKYN